MEHKRAHWHQSFDRKMKSFRRRIFFFSFSFLLLLVFFCVGDEKWNYNKLNLENCVIYIFSNLSKQFSPFALSLLFEEWEMSAGRKASNRRECN